MVTINFGNGHDLSTLTLIPSIDAEAREENFLKQQGNE